MDRQQPVEATSPPTIAACMNVSTGSVVQDDGLHIKEERGDTDMNIGPTVLQHVDSYYSTKQPDTSVVKEESTINGYNGSPIPCDGVKEATIEDECRGSEPRIYICQYCRKTFTIRSRMLHHITCLHSSRSYECSQCKKSFKCEPYLMRHKAIVHSADAQHSEETQPEQRAQSRLYRCDKCPKTFKHNNDLRVHCKRVHSTGSYECTECNLTYKCAEYLANHIRNVHKQQYECAGCKKICKSKQSLHLHVTWCREQLRSADPQHSEEKSRLYKCDKCQNTFKRNNDLRAHYRCVHGTGSNKCTECDLKYKCAEYLASHMRNVHCNRQYECTGCKKICKSKLVLRYHVPRCRELRSAGSELRNYVCDYCQKPYNSKYNLQIHIASVHTNTSYKCSQCNKSFKCKQYVTNHMAMVHSAGTRECNVCGKSVRPHCLRSHMLNMHRDKQVQCVLCGEVMKSKLHLRKHLNDCYGEQSAGSHQQFTCSNCGKNFKLKRNCQKHEKICKCTRPTASNTSAVASTSAQQHSVVIVKEEPADGELELAPVVFPQMDRNYRPHKQERQLD